MAMFNHPPAAPRAAFVLGCCLLAAACGGGGGGSPAPAPNPSAPAPIAMLELLAGTPGGPGYGDGPAASARFHYPWGLVVDSSGNLHVADALNGVIRKVTPGGVATTV